MVALYLCTCNSPLNFELLQHVVKDLDLLWMFFGIAPGKEEQISPSISCSTRYTFACAWWIQYRNLRYRQSIGRGS